MVFIILGNSFSISLAIIPASPILSLAISPADPCKKTPREAALTELMPWAKSETIIPDRMSPVPAVASPGLAKGLINLSPFEAATIVKGPLKTTICFQSSEDWVAISSRFVSS